MQEISEKELETAIVNKQRTIIPGTTRDALVKFLDAPPYRIKNTQIVNDDMRLFGQLLAKIIEAEYDKMLSEINDTKAAVLVEYMHRFMDFVGTEGGTSGNALKYYEKILGAFGKGIVLRAGFKPISIVNRVNNFSFDAS